MPNPPPMDSYILTKYMYQCLGWGIEQFFLFFFVQKTHKKLIKLENGIKYRFFTIKCMCLGTL